MKALVLESYNNLVVRDVPVPEPGPQEVLIRVKSAAICGSDVHGYDGTTGRRIPPVIMGHEASGRIERTGSGVSRWQSGDRVTFDSTIYRLDDWYTLRGLYNLGEGRRVLGVSCDEYRQNGAFAEYLIVPQHILYALPEGLSFDHAALTEPLAVALHAVALTPIEIGETVAVIGAGVIGLMVTAALRQRGCAHIVVSDVVEERLALAREMGATGTVNPASATLAEACREYTAGRGADHVIDAVGLQATVDSGIEALRRGGTLTMVGNIARELNIPLQRIVAGQMRIQGSCAIRGEYPAALNMMATGAIPLEKMISVTGTLEDAPAIFRRLHDGEAGLIKAILHP